jgi:ATP-dependent DNA helicase RecG
MVPTRPLSIPESFSCLQTPLRQLNGIGPKRAAQLENFGLITVEHLLYHLPFRYQDRRSIKKLSETAVGSEDSFLGQIVALEKKYIPRRRRQILLATIKDDTGSMALVWYRAPAYLADKLARGQTLLVYGRVEQGMGWQKRMIHPDFEVLETVDDARLQRILPIYLRPGGLPLSLIRKWIAQAMTDYGKFIPSALPEPTLRRRRLLSVERALATLHTPPLDSDITALNGFSSAAHQALIFDELFCLQVGLGLRRKARTGAPGMTFRRKENGLTTKMRELMNFKLTGAQKRVLMEIAADMESSFPMQRLIQGDVGSGKTIVAWFASLRVIDHGYQALWMAPTEILAEQHFNNLRGYVRDLGLKAALLTASVPASDKKKTLKSIEAGETQLVVGTHALIQKEVRAPRMGLGVIDEQHRFGVLQRLSLQNLVERDNGTGLPMAQPHMLLLSATPIPRSLAMVLYGDMEVSILDELPPGRSPVQTRVFSDSSRPAMYRLALNEVQQGRQVFIVYPLVEASEQLQQIRDATRMAEELANGIFKGSSLGLVHGRIRVEERDKIMRAFRDRKISVLVATTVIEVGIDIPNATVMIVEHAERFGLSQLHQLRGRVGRGQAPSYCFLVHRNAQSGDGLSRLKVMEKEQDGFRIAEADLALRGPGELLGTRQSGMADFHLANLARDSRILLEAREEALAWLERDPELKSDASSTLREVLRHRWGQRLQLGAVV